MRQVKKTILFLLIAFLTSCTEKSGKSTLEFAQTLHFAEEACQSVNERVDSVIYLPLQSTEQSALRNIDKMYFRNGLIYAGDLSSRKVAAFHNDGTVAFVVNRSGHGEGEYQDFKSFTVDGEHIYVVDNTRRAVLLYDCRTGTYEEQKPLPVMSWDIEAATNGEFLLTFVPNIGGLPAIAQPLCRVFITDADFQIRKGLFEYDENYRDALGLQTYFTHDEEHIYFSSYWFDGMTAFDIHNPENYEHIAIDFENRLTEEERTGKSPLDRSAANYLGATPFFTSHYIGMLITGPEYSTDYLYDKRDSVFCTNIEEDCSGAFLLPVATCRDMFVSYISDYDTYAALVECGFRKAGQSIEEALKEGGMVLILYHMRA